MQQFIRSAQNSEQVINLATIAAFQLECGFINATLINSDQICLFSLTAHEMEGDTTGDPIGVFEIIQQQFLVLLSVGAGLIDQHSTGLSDDPEDNFGGHRRVLAIRHGKRQHVHTGIGRSRRPSKGALYGVATGG